MQRLGLVRKCCIVGLFVGALCGLPENVQVDECRWGFDGHQVQRYAIGDGGLLLELEYFNLEVILKE
jgi:hypothetical protein